MYDWQDINYTDLYEFIFIYILIYLKGLHCH